LQTFRGLVSSQRAALAEDWELARQDLRKRLKVLRAEVRATLRKGWGRRVAVPLIRRFTGSPEWALVPAALAALAVAVWRSSDLIR
jgi:hypothetical protein